MVTVDDPLSEAQTRQLLDADVELSKILFAAKVARFNGWTLVVMGALCLPLALFSGWSLLVAAVLFGFAYVELSGAAATCALKPEGLTRLGFNQLGLLVAVVVYCALRIRSAFVGDGLGASLGEQLPGYDAQLDALQDPALQQGLGAMADSLSSMDEIYRGVVLLVYGLVIFFSIAIQGALFFYYRSRSGRMTDYLTRTPSWVRRLQERRG